MHYLKSDMMNLTLVIQVYKSSNTCQNSFQLKIVVVHKLLKFDASVFDNFSDYNISRSNATSRGAYTFPYRTDIYKSI